MPKFKYLFLTILLGSFVSSNNIGYSMEDLGNNPVDNYDNIGSLQSNMNKLVSETNNIVCENGSYYNKVFLDLKDNIEEFNDAINQQNLEEIQKSTMYIYINSLELNQLSNFFKIGKNEKYLKHIKILINRICNIYFREKMSLDQDQIFISYAGFPILDDDEFNIALININLLVNEVFNNLKIHFSQKSTIDTIDEFKSNFKSLMIHITQKKTTYNEFDKMVEHVFYTIKSLLQINEINSQVEIKTLIETIRQELIEICIYYINNNIFKYNIDITDLFPHN